MACSRILLLALAAASALRAPQPLRVVGRPLRAAPPGLSSRDVAQVVSTPPAAVAKRLAQRKTQETARILQSKRRAAETLLDAALARSRVVARAPAVVEPEVAAVAASLLAAGALLAAPVVAKTASLAAIAAGAYALAVGALRPNSRAAARLRRLGKPLVARRAAPAPPCDHVMGC